MSVTPRFGRSAAGRTRSEENRGVSRTIVSLALAGALTAAVVAFSPTAYGAELRERLGIGQEPTYVLDDR